MTQIITSRGGGGGGGGGTSYTAGCGIDITNNEISVDTSVIAEKSDLSGYQTKANMVCNLNNADNSHYPSAKAVADAITSAGGGDMLKSVYDPNNVEADAFDYCNFTNTPTIPTDNCQLANGCCYAKTCDIPTDNCQLANGCGYTTCTGTLTASNISNTAYGNSWCGVTTVAPSKNAVYAKVSAIDGLIPSAATSSNQLADKDYVNDSINSVTAFYITKNAAGDQFATYAELAAATTFYSGGVVRTPTRNDYTIVLDDETHSDEVTRYIYNSGWEYQYTINESPMTQAQLDALNSGITAAKVSAYDCIPIITDNCQIANGCGYTTCTGTVSTCADVIGALGYTPYNSTNPNGYTTCTGTVVASDLTSYVLNSCVACINGCCLTLGGDISISGGGKFVDVLVVGGGGGGAGSFNNKHFGDGGGGGAVVEQIGYPISDSVSVVVGDGGTGGTRCCSNTCRYGVCGGDSSFGALRAFGGGGGGCCCGGVSGNGYDGGRGCYAQTTGGAGGGGAGGYGLDICFTDKTLGNHRFTFTGYTFCCTYGGGGGEGVASGISGEIKRYGGGGGGGGTGGCRGIGLDGGGCGGTFGSTSCTSGGYACPATYFGGGGSGAGWCCVSGNIAYYSGCKGYQGVVIVRYPLDGSYGFSCATGGDCVYECNGYCIHCFCTIGANTFTIVS